MPDAALHAPNDYALVIGINDYPAWDGGDGYLNAPNDDALAFHKWLIDPVGGGLPSENVRLLQSTANPLAPLQQAIDDAFKEIGDRSEGARGRFYFYFSGHGYAAAGGWMQQSLCLPDWSSDAPNAALNVDSYVKASVGCLGFKESVFFLDCCRVREIAPVGNRCRLECGDPQTTARHFAIVYACDHYEKSYEGKVGQDGADEEPDEDKELGPAIEGNPDNPVRSYFTLALLNILTKETITVGSLVERLEVDVPALKPGQIARNVTTTGKILLGPPNRKPPPAGDPASPEVGGVEREHAEDIYSLTVEVRSAFRPVSPGEEMPSPLSGQIVVFRGSTLVGHATAHFSAKLPVGDYSIHILHGEASQGHRLRLEKDTAIAFDLPSRRSASPLNATLGQSKDVIDSVVAESKWDREKSRFQQAIFINFRQTRGSEDRADIFKGQLFLEIDDFDGSRSVPVGLGNRLVPVGPNARVGLTCFDSDRLTALPVPIAVGWDTQIFITAGDRGEPSLATASVLMRLAGEGFDPSDGLIDACERAIFDLATGGRGPDEATLYALLRGRFRNPLFRLVGAHFLLRKLSRSETRSENDLALLDEVIIDLDAVFGRRSPDVIALRLARAAWFKEDPVNDADGALWHTAPLLRSGLEVFVQATADSKRRFPALSHIVAGLDPNSPWTCWRRRTGIGLMSASWPHGLKQSTDISVRTLRGAQTDMVEALWRLAGYTTTRTGEQSDIVVLEGTRVGPRDDIWGKTQVVLDVPLWLVNFVREALQQSERTKIPLNIPMMVRRTGMPADLISAARSILELQPVVEQAADDQAVDDETDGGGKGVAA